jgi:hypothetical protein
MQRLLLLLPLLLPMCTAWSWIAAIVAPCLLLLLLLSMFAA